MFFIALIVLNIYILPLQMNMGSSAKGPNNQGEALRQMLSQHMVSSKPLLITLIMRVPIRLAGSWGYLAGSWCETIPYNIVIYIYMYIYENRNEATM